MGELEDCTNRPEAFLEGELRQVFTVIFSCADYDCFLLVPLVVFDLCNI